jgi:hypothetical protein
MSNNIAIIIDRLIKQQMIAKLSSASPTNWKDAEKAARHTGHSGSRRPPVNLLPIGE